MYLLNDPGSGELLTGLESPKDDLQNFSASIPSSSSQVNIRGLMVLHSTPNQWNRSDVEEASEEILSPSKNVLDDFRQSPLAMVSSDNYKGNSTSSSLYFTPPDGSKIFPYQNIQKNNEEVLKSDLYFRK